MNMFRERIMNELICKIKVYCLPPPKILLYTLTLILLLFNNSLYSFNIENQFRKFPCKSKISVLSPPVLMK